MGNGKYFDQFGSHERLTHEDEIALAKEIQAGREATDSLTRDDLSVSEKLRLRNVQKHGVTALETFVKANFGLVFGEAKRFARKDLSHDDLVQEGMIGLTAAVKGFDWTKGHRFSTYAVPLIRGAMHTATDNTGALIRIPVNAQRERRTLEQARQSFSEEFQREPNRRELSERSGIPMHRIDVVLSSRYTIKSLDERAGHEEGDRTIGDTVADQRIAATDEVEERLDQEGLMEALATLRPPVREVMVLRIGRGGAGLTLEETARRLGRPRERVLHQEREGKKALRHLPQFKELGF